VDHNVSRGASEHQQRGFALLRSQRQPRNLARRSFEHFFESTHSRMKCSRISLLQQPLAAAFTSSIMSIDDRVITGISTPFWFAEARAERLPRTFKADDGRVRCFGKADISVCDPHSTPGNAESVRDLSSLPDFLHRLHDSFGRARKTSAFDHKGRLADRSRFHTWRLPISCSSRRRRSRPPARLSLAAFSAIFCDLTRLRFGSVTFNPRRPHLVSH